jgi:hypothetical protein
VVFKNKIKIISIRNSVTISILLNWNKLKRKLQYQNQCTWMTSFSSVQYTSSGTPRAFPQVKKQVHLRKDARSSDVLHFFCFGEETWNCMHFLVNLSLKTLWAGVKHWRTALHRFYIYRKLIDHLHDLAIWKWFKNVYISFDLKCICAWCLDNWSRSVNICYFLK